MFKKIFLFVIVLFIADTVFAFAAVESGWREVNRRPVSAPLTNIYIESSDRIWITGKPGIILSTFNRGVNWGIHYLSTPQEIKGIIKLKNKQFFAVASDVSLFKKDNYKPKWNNIFSIRNAILLKASALGKDIFMIAKTEQKDSLPAVSFIIVDENGKVKEQNSIAYNVSVSDASVCENYCILTGLSEGRHSVILITDRKGKTLNKIYFKDRYYNTQYFLNMKNGWIAGKNRVAIIKDRGSFRKEVVIDGLYEEAVINRIFFKDEKNGFLLGIDRKNGVSLFFKTSNGGLNWEPIKGFEYIFNLYDIRFADNKNGWVSGTSGAILKTTDGGKTWNDTTSGFPQSFTDIQFVTPKSGWIVGGLFESQWRQYPVILKTSDGGKTWAKQFSGKGFSLYDIFMINDNVGWVSGSHGIILSTNNGGKVWKRVNIGTGKFEQMLCIRFSDRKNGLILSDKALYKTVDSGQTWKKETKFEHGYDSYGAKLLIIGKTVIITQQTSPYLLISNNSGKIFNAKKINNKAQGICAIHQNHDKEIWFISETYNAKKGIAIYSLYRSDDEGKSFHLIQKNLPIVNPFFGKTSLFFVTSSIGYLTSRNQIYKTVDGGNTWKKQMSRTENPLSAIFFINERQGVIAGSLGTILFTVNGGD